jgi:UPF0716 protein FxsA
MPLILLFILALPISEFYGFIAIGELIGLWPTLALVAASMVTGIVILRRRGYATLELAQKSLAKRESPLPPLLHGLGIAVAGALLVIPGFVTDIVALLLLMPAVRNALGRALWAALMRSGNVMVWASRDERGGDVIEGEFREVEDQPKRLG